MRAALSSVVFAICAVVSCAAAARADDGPGGSIGLSLAPLIGTHEESGSLAHPPPIPLPIGQIALRDREFEVFFESLPGSPSIDQSASNGDTLSSHLAFFDTVARIHDPSDRVWIGAGEIAYNQSTTYRYYYSPFASTSASRIAGGRYEIGGRLTPKSDRIRLWLDFMPALLGDDHERYLRQHIAIPERGSQFETQLLIANPHGPFEFDYGARYVNYQARFMPNGALADRNTGVLPFATFAYRFGRR